jgi:hypothetical protein
MQRKSFWIIPALLAIGAAAMLRADDTPAPVMPASPGDSAATLQAMSNYAWFMEHYSSIAKDSDAMGITAVFAADDMMRAQGPEAEADFFNKMLFETKSRAVQRAVRMKLVDIYKTLNRPDRAMEQLQAIMTEQPS